jgi:hypothetical protein
MNQMRAFLEADHFESCNLETDDGKDKPHKISFYGFCPTCGSDGVSRERRPDGNDICRLGHVYPSREARLDRPTRRELSK